MTKRRRALVQVGRGLYRTEYTPDVMDRHYRATGPLQPETCRCYVAGKTYDEEAREARCWKCGRPIGPATTTNTN